MHTGSTLKRLLGRAASRGRLMLHGWIGYREDATELAKTAQAFWNDLTPPQRRQEAHWRGHGVFGDDTVWLDLGRRHLELLQRVMAENGAGLDRPRVLEWGCGGGANAVHFGREASTFYGVDISADSLAECGRQMADAGMKCFVPVLVEAHRARSALPQIGSSVDLFLCLYVMELLPTEEHAFEILDIAAETLRPGGWALIQIRRTVPGPAGGSRPWDYAQNMAHNVRFREDVFSRACQQRGLEVRHVERVDEVPELNERDYVYFVLQRRQD